MWKPFNAGTLEGLAPGASHSIKNNELGGA